MIKLCVLVAQLCQTLFNPMDSSRLGFLVHGILQARILECLAISFYRGSDLPAPRIELGSSALQADSLLPEPLAKPK